MKAQLLSLTIAVSIALSGMAQTIPNETSSIVTPKCKSECLTKSPPSCPKLSPAIVEVYNFLKETGHYFIATVDGTQPRVRPFGTALLFEGKLYIQTGRTKDVAKQITKNGLVELCAYNGKTWLRLSGTLVDDKRVEVRKAMLDAHPSLKNLYKAEDENTMVLYFKDATAVFNSFDGTKKTIQF